MFAYKSGKMACKFFILNKEGIFKFQGMLLNVKKKKNYEALRGARHRARVVEKRKAYKIFVGNTPPCCTEKEKGVKLLKINLR